MSAFGVSTSESKQGSSFQSLSSATQGHSYHRGDRDKSFTLTAASADRGATVRQRALAW